MLLGERLTSLPVGLVSKEEHDSHGPADNDHQRHGTDESLASLIPVAAQLEHGIAEESDDDAEHGH